MEPTATGPARMSIPADPEWLDADCDYCQDSDQVLDVPEADAKLCAGCRSRALTEAGKRRVWNR